MIYECNDIAKVEMLFGDWYLPDLRESPEHVELKFFVTDPETPKSAMMFYDGDAFYAGEPDEELVRNKPKGSISMLPQNEAWEKLIESCFPDAEKITRYAIKKEANFDLEKLKAIVDTLPEGYELKRIDEEIYDLCLNVTDPDLEDVVGCYDTKEEFFKYSRGFVILKDGKVVAGASSCFRYCDGIEIEIDTDKTERGKGLASVVGAKLILSCLEDGLRPRWDAANLTSVHISEKLGYKFSHEYVYYYLSKAFDSLIKNPDKSKWADYCGEYDQLVKDFRLEKIWMKDGDLYGKASNEIRDNFEFKLLPIGENKFGRAGGSVEITFGDGCLIIDDIICKKIS